MKLSEAFKDYQSQVIITRNLSRKTYENYRYACGSFISYFGEDIKVSKIKVKDINRYYSELLRTHSSDTLRGYIVAIRAVLKFCQKNGVRTCDVEKILIPRREKKIPKWLDADDVRKFIGVVTAPKRGYAEINRVRNELLCKILFVSGARISEVVALDRRSIKNGEFVVTGKSKEPRVCYISKEIEELIEKYLEMRTDSCEALFANTYGNRLTASMARSVFRRACKQSGFSNIHPHTFRHSFATHMLSEGVGIREVGEMLGHQNLDTTKIYTHLTNPSLKAIHQQIMS